MTEPVLRDVLIPHAAYRNATQALEKAFAEAQSGPDTILVPLFGPSGSGKSTIVESCECAHPSYRDDYGLKVPVVRMKVPSRPTVKGLVTELLYALEDPLYDKGTEQSMLIRLRRLLKAAAVRMVVLDEFQHFVDKASYQVMHHVADTLKVIADETRVVLVVVGLERSMAVIEQNEQLARRCIKQIMLPYFDWASTQLRQEFRSILRAVDKKLEYLDAVKLSDEKIAFRIFCATGGVISNVMRLLRTAEAYALDSPTRQLDLACLASAYEDVIYRSSRAVDDPFDPAVNLSASAELLSRVAEMVRHGADPTGLSPRQAEWRAA